MSKELADRLEMIRHRLTLAKDRWGVGMVDETIAALRSEPVATVVVSGGEYISLSANPHQLGQLKNMNGQALYAAPSREDQRATDSTVGAGNSRETDDLSHPVSQQAHPSRTDRQEPGLSAEQIEEMRVQIKAAQGNLWAQEGRAALQKKTDALCDMALRSLTAPTVSEKGETDELASAAEQILDDMGSDYCVCPAAKEQLRMALDAHLSRKEPK